MLLLDSNADVNKYDDNQRTPLIMGNFKFNQFIFLKDPIKASWKGHIEIVKNLLNQNQDVNKIDNDGCSALMWGQFKKEDNIILITNNLIYLSIK